MKTYNNAGMGLKVTRIAAVIASIRLRGIREQRSEQ